jgi:hypothetical protein
MVFQQLGTLLVVGDHAQPVIGVVLLDSKVGGKPIAWVVDILCVGSQLGHLGVLYTSHFFGLVCNVGGSCEDLRRHIEISQVWRDKIGS